MPNIVIKEYDKTSAGIGLYANFAVLVPGYYKPREYVSAKQAYMYGGKTVFSAANDSVPDEGESIWTEDGVCEFTKQEDFIAQVGKVAAKEGITLKEGVYAQLTGPSFESPAEIRLLGNLGVSAVGNLIHFISDL